MTDKEYMKKEHERNVKAFARKFVSDHYEEIAKGNYDYSDAALKETFKDCALPLRPIFYDECRAEIDKLIKEENDKTDALYARLDQLEGCEDNPVYVAEIKKIRGQLGM